MLSPSIFPSVSFSSCFLYLFFYFSFCFFHSVLVSISCSVCHFLYFFLCLYLSVALCYLVSLALCLFLSLILCLFLSLSLYPFVSLVPCVSLYLLISLFLSHNYFHLSFNVSFLALFFFFRVHFMYILVCIKMFKFILSTLLKMALITQSIKPFYLSLFLATAIKIGQDFFFKSVAWWFEVCVCSFSPKQLFWSISGFVYSRKNIWTHSGPNVIKLFKAVIHECVG